MLLSSIDFASLEDRTDPGRWGVGTDRDRKIYYGDNRWFKIWGEKYMAATVAAVGGEFKTIDGLDTLHGFQVGLYNRMIASAFIEYIVDGNDLIRGYVTADGPTLKAPPDSQFVKNMFNACVHSGWVYSDFCNSNIISVNGTLSLIDFDTHLVKLDMLDVEFEKKHGALRPHVVPLFRSLLLEHCGKQ